MLTDSASATEEPSANARRQPNRKLHREFDGVLGLSGQPPGRRRALPELPALERNDHRRRERAPPARWLRRFGLGLSARWALALPRLRPNRGNAPLRPG